MAQEKEKLISEAKQLYKKIFNDEPKYGAMAPGRVNLIGEHTDYNDGFVLPIALDLMTVVVGSPNDTDKVNIYSKKDETEMVSIDIDLNNLKPGEPSWANYAKGVLKFFPKKTLGFNSVIVTNVPLGGGLSSSASFEVAFYTFLEILNNLKSDLVKKALACQKAEHEFAGMPCGIMDQFISVMGKEGYALLIDCRSQTFELIPLEDDNLVVLITNSNVKHNLGTSEYPMRRDQCLKAAEILKLKSLRDANLEDIKKLENLKVDPKIIQRARHVVTEILRTLKAAEALKQKNYEKFGELMYESHKSLKDDFEVSCKELDQLVEIASKIDGVYGSRMTGGGFGGCTVTLMKKNKVNDVISSIKKNFNGKADFYISKASNGGANFSI